MFATDHWPQEWLNKLQEQKCEQKRKTNRACKSVNEAENCPSPITDFGAASFFKSSPAISAQ